MSRTEPRGAVHKATTLEVPFRLVGVAYTGQPYGGVYRRTSSLWAMTLHKKVIAHSIQLRYRRVVVSLVEGPGVTTCDPRLITSQEISC